MDIVIARYNEDLKWIEWSINSDLNFIVYNKGSTFKQKGCTIKNIPNFGREGETFLRHIIENYDNLAHVTLFIQGNPFEHTGLMITNIQTYLSKLVTQINPQDNILSPFGCQLYPEILKGNVKEYVNYLFPTYRDDKIMFSCGCQYMITKNMIRKIPLKVFKAVRRLLLNAEVDNKTQYTFGKNYLNGHVLERLFTMIFLYPINDEIVNDYA